MTVRHVVLIRLRPEVSEDTTDLLAKDMRDLCMEMEGVLHCEVNRDRGLVPRNAHLVLIAEFADENAFQRYLSDPRHAAFVTNSLQQMVASLASIQY